jgi:hypothetical protein
MTEQLVAGAVLMGENGEITEDQMDVMKIVNVNTGKDKNFRPMHRQRATVMNNPLMAAKWKVYNDAMVEKRARKDNDHRVTADPVIIALRAAQKLASAAERARRSRFSEVEKKAEAAAKAKATRELNKANRAAAAVPLHADPVPLVVEAAVAVVVEAVAVVADPAVVADVGSGSDDSDSDDSDSDDSSMDDSLFSDDHLTMMNIEGEREQFRD